MLVPCYITSGMADISCCCLLNNGYVISNMWKWSIRSLWCGSFPCGKCYLYHLTGRGSELCWLYRDGWCWYALFYENLSVLSDKDLQV
jgi:hypothetical protein